MLIIVGVVVIAAGVWWSVGSSGPVSDPATAARTTFPDLPAPTGDPTLPGLATAAPAPGAVVQVAGPFDDRFELTGLRFDGSNLTGTLRVTSDVSELLELEVLAGFYDDGGALLGTAQDTWHADGQQNSATARPSGGADGPPDETYDFRIAVPAGLGGRASAAAVGIPVLVNE